MTTTRFWLKGDKEKLITLLEWFLSHDFEFTRSKDYAGLKELNCLLLRFDYTPFWLNFSRFGFLYAKQDERDRLLEVYKKAKGNQ